VNHDESAKSARLMLVRHGEGRANVDGVIAGLLGCEGLTELGRRQVRALSERWSRTSFRPDVLVSSPVRRARESAEILAAGFDGLDAVEDCALCELHNGEADGLTWQEYDAKYGRFNITAEPSRSFAPGAESWADVMTRVGECVQELASQHLGETVLAR
jgi:broad specificity phosphatase PhoE